MKKKKRKLVARLISRYSFVFPYGARVPTVSGPRLRGSTMTLIQSVGLLYTISPTQRPLTTHNTHKRQASMLEAGFEPAIPASERTQTHRQLQSPHFRSKYFELAMSKLVLQTAAGDWGRFCVSQTGRFSSGVRYFGWAADSSRSRRWITATRNLRCYATS